MADEKKYITSEELKKHNHHQDLWISIQGKIYNVTDWAKVHPDGDIPLLNPAGQDVTDAFTAFHPGTAWKYLDQFFTGYHLEDFKVSDVSIDYRILANHLVRSGTFEKKVVFDFNLRKLMTLWSGAVNFTIFGTLEFSGLIGI
ncbi:Delta 8 Fatty Acid Desaturase [Orobanche minor]